MIENRVWGVGRENQERRGCGELQLIHVAVQQKLAQQGKATTPQLKKKQPPQSMGKRSRNCKLSSWKSRDSYIIREGLYQLLFFMFTEITGTNHMNGDMRKLLLGCNMKSGDC